MADGIVLNLGSGGDTTAADEVGGFKIPRIKIVHGADGTNDGDVAATNPLPVKVVGSATSGYSIFRSIDLDEGALEQVKGSAGTVYGMWVTNTATATRFIKFYNATSGTVGTGTPVITIGIAGNATDDITGQFGPGGAGIAFSTGICVGASTGVADADTGALGANDIVINVFYS
jgi:hypothetical protein